MKRDGFRSKWSHFLRVLGIKTALARRSIHSFIAIVVHAFNSTQWSKDSYYNNAPLGRNFFPNIWFNKLCKGVGGGDVYVF